MKLIILDRDGVINHDSEKFIKKPSEWKSYPQSLEAIKKLKLNDWIVTVATNQSGIGRKLFTTDTLKKIHLKMHNELKHIGTNIDYLTYCPHLPEDKCTCRKPNPGMYIEIAKRFNYDLSKAIVVGDSLRDIQAAEAVGAKPILVLTGKGRNTIKNKKLSKKIHVYKNLERFVSDLVTYN